MAKMFELAYLQPGCHGSLRYENLTLDRLIEQCEYVFPNIYDSHDLDTIVREFNENGVVSIRKAKNLFSDYSNILGDTSLFRKPIWSSNSRTAI